MSTAAPNRRALYAMAQRAAALGDFPVVREVIVLGGVSDNAMENDHVIAEWEAEYHERDFSTYPRNARPRLPRPHGYDDEED